MPSSCYQVGTVRASKDRVPSRHRRGQDSRIYFEHKRKLGEGASESASVELSRLMTCAQVQGHPQRLCVWRNFTTGSVSISTVSAGTLVRDVAYDGE